VSTAEEIDCTAHRGEHFLEATLRRIFTSEDGVVDIRKRLQHGGPTLDEGIANDILRRIATILRNARSAVLEVLITEWHDDLEVCATDHFKNAIGINRKVAHAERWVVHVFGRHLAETLGRNRLDEVVGVAKRQREA